MTVVIKVRLNGPYAIDLSTADVALIDHDGNPIAIPTEKKTLALCRCGHSTTKPFCDASHRRLEWVACPTEDPRAGDPPTEGGAPTGP